MERHKCKLCSRTFANGRALGGHMKAHLATLPLPPKPQRLHHSLNTFSSNSSSRAELEDDDNEEEDEEEQEKALINYALRENPKKCFRLADPEFNSGSVVQDRESETESKNPTRRRSKRPRRPANSQPKARPKLSFMESPEPVSSVSDTSPEEDVAMCLMMLSRDRWSKNTNAAVGSDALEEEEERSVEEIKLRRVRRKHQCESCEKTFRSSRALGSHRSICGGSGNDSKIFECPFCSKVFGSGQALGGHKRSHLVPSSSSTANDSTRFKDSFIDLNLPAPTEEDDLSVVSDAQFDD
ncbi:hypothetical protein PHAVU_002G058900 [Phaseolus vulgaris]|uniref:C2H2-type domain-containing protein n=1 Tax=Phaseolus vulgaris TaxID=3885 RepID=V7CK74_PHAVU|nr:hypothetical protein PHAVU_002G058900g [Phaseolus vulgaris]ESW29301.1 hypothetical protein PHAVU_002G058900g [Phaseolus vulgaris]